MTQLFINLIGHNASGKSTLASRLTSDLSLSIVSGDAFREFVRGTVTYFKRTDLSFPDHESVQLDPLVTTYRNNLTDILLQAEQNVLFDGGGSKAAFRRHYLGNIKRDFPDVRSIIIHVRLEETKLIHRLKERDSQSTGSRWLRQYEDLKRDGFEEPQFGEADELLQYTQDNYDDILTSLKRLSA